MECRELADKVCVCDGCDNAVVQIDNFAGVVLTDMCNDCDYHRDLEIDVPCTHDLLTQHTT